MYDNLLYIFSFACLFECLLLFTFQNWYAQYIAIQYLLLCSGFYLMYAKLEENHGLARHAMTIYERATKAVLPDEQFEVRQIVCEKYSSPENVYFWQIEVKTTRAMTGCEQQILYRSGAPATQVLTLCNEKVCLQLYLCHWPILIGQVRLKAS